MHRNRSSVKDQRNSGRFYIDIEVWNVRIASGPEISCDSVSVVPPTVCNSVDFKRCVITIVLNSFSNVSFKKCIVIVLKVNLYERILLYLDWLVTFGGEFSQIFHLIHSGCRVNNFLWITSRISAVTNVRFNFDVVENRSCSWSMTERLIHRFFISSEMIQ